MLHSTLSGEKLKVTDILLTGRQRFALRPAKEMSIFRSVSCSVSLSDISHSFFLLSPLFPLTIFLYSPNEWDHIMFVFLRLTYFTQHNTFHVPPCRSKYWVFVISNGWVIFHCIHKAHLLYPFIFRWTPRLLPQFDYCGHCCYKQEILRGTLKIPL